MTDLTSALASWNERYGDKAQPQPAQAPRGGTAARRAPAAAASLAPPAAAEAEGAPPPSPAVIHPTSLPAFIERFAGRSIEVVMTPDLAEALLALNVHNRPLQRGWVEELTRRISRGAWRNTGAPIVVTRQGTLNDGQHRLLAVVRSGVPVPMDLRFGIEREAFAVTDTGRARTPGQMLSTAGFTNGNRMAAAAAILIRFAETPAGATRLSDNKNIAHDRVLAVARANPGLNESIAVVNIPINPIHTGAGVAAHYLSWLHNPDRSAAFWRVVRDGVTDGPRNPAFLLRERMVRDAIARTKLSTELRFAMMLKAWLMFEAGRDAAFLRLLDSEPFPRVPVAVPGV